MAARLEAAAAAVDAAAEVTTTAAEHLARAAAEDGRISVAKLDRHQVLAYDLAHAASALEGCRVMLDYGGRGELEGMLAGAFVADVVADVAGRIVARDEVWGVSPDVLAPALNFVADRRSPEFLESLAARLPQAGTGPAHLSDDFELVRETFHRFAEAKVRPVAEHVHRANADIPEDVIAGLAEIGGFGLSVPEEYGGYAAGGEADYLGMVVATEELSWGSLGVGGSLITRPDYGSDVAGVATNATAVDGGYLINGVKTWATFAGRADVLMLLARTDPDRSKTHRGLSLFVVEKDAVPGHSFALEQTDGGKAEGRAIDTLGYRGMHSYEVSFSDWLVPAENLVGEEGGLGKGFYLQMEGFENGRLQTAARAVGLMQAAFEAGLEYAQQRQVFGKPVFDYQLSRVKLARMAALIAAGRQFSYDVARRMGRGEGTLSASMVKAYVCRSAEWVTREAMQLHGGMGYAEEFAVSRYFVDARVLSIFEGADETLCLRVIARRLAEQALEAP